MLHHHWRSRIFALGTEPAVESCTRMGLAERGQHDVQATKLLPQIIRHAPTWHQARQSLSSRSPGYGFTYWGHQDVGFVVGEVVSSPWRLCVGFHPGD
jgi:hypothetical protein